MSWQTLPIVLVGLADEGRLDETYIGVLDNPPTSKTLGGTLLHVLTHTTMHRWEIQHMLQ